MVYIISKKFRIVSETVTKPNISTMEISATKNINDFLYKKGISKSKLGEMIGHSRQNISKKLSKNDIEVGLLFKISIALGHDFFTELSKSLPHNVRSVQEVDSSSEVEEALRKFIETNYPEVFK